MEPCLVWALMIDMSWKIENYITSSSLYLIHLLLYVVVLFSLSSKVEHKELKLGEVLGNTLSVRSCLCMFRNTFYFF